MIEDSPLVSVIIPTHNRRKLLERALDSVFSQTWSALEVVVVDDASTDDTPNYLETLRAEKENLTVVRNETSQGAAKSRNIAIKNSTGEFITGLDDDDYWLPQRIEELMNAFNDGFSAVCSYDRMVTNTKERVWKKPEVITLDDLLYYNRVGNQVLTKKEYLEAVGGYDESLPSAQDYDLWIRLAKKFGPVKTVQEPLQVVNMEEDRERISTDDKKIEGYRRCFLKHQQWMKPEHKSYQKYRLKLSAGEEVGWIEMVRATPLKLYVKEITRKLFL